MAALDLAIFPFIFGFIFHGQTLRINTLHKAAYKFPEGCFNIMIATAIAESIMNKILLALFVTGSMLSTAPVWILKVIRPLLLKLLKIW
ncbi:hypothetical protein E0H80_12745 [Acinetobacter sp. ANC 4779]|uniref:hypothetical protein n=1 Tax=Acinetobacter sp. ANC 4779 TaxID=2529848 RepID=UPI00103EBA7C|nr:hypothetical protein [Acinetobacter sp. ANC 4779]TCB49176.1 hypothetical protein E0H80_12745 [Acinetobacter sp. ANC 4779]